LFALITRETRKRDGNVHAGIIAAVSWVAEHLPVRSLNLILTTPSELFALRFPTTDTLYVLPRAAGGHRGDRPLHHRSSLGTQVHSEEAAQRRVVVLASEPMDEDPAWRPLESGELLHVSPKLEINAARVLFDPPAHPLHLPPA
jgi:predicted glutamine amidotransferase